MTTWAWSFNGLTFGEGTSIDLIEMRGLDLPNVRSSAFRYGTADGQAAGLRTYEPRTITAELEFSAATAAAFETLLDTVRRALKRTDTDGVLVAELPGQVPKRIYCSVESRTTRVNLRWSYLFPGMVVQWVADDPLVYADATTTTDLDPGGGAVTVPNAGDEATRNWSAVIAGPATDPKIAHANGTVLDFTGYSIAAAQTITIDAYAYTVKRETGVDVRDKLTRASDFFSILPGGSALTFTATGTTAATDLDVTVRAAWSALT